MYWIALCSQLEESRILTRSSEWGIVALIVNPPKSFETTKQTPLQLIRFLQVSPRPDHGGCPADRLAPLLDAGRPQHAGRIFKNVLGGKMRICPFNHDKCMTKILERIISSLFHLFLTKSKSLCLLDLSFPSSSSLSFHLSLCVPC